MYSKGNYFMPFPVVHAVAGYTVYQVSRKQEDFINWKLALYCMFMGNFADLDFIPGLFIGDATRFHHGAMHSFGAAFIAGFLVAAVVKYFSKKIDPVKAFLVTAVSYASHILLDILNGAWKPMPVFWPLTSKAFFGNPAAMHKAHSVSESGIFDLWDFLHFLMQPYYLKQMASEIILFVAAAGLIHIGLEIRRRFRLGQGYSLSLSKKLIKE